MGVVDNPLCPVCVLEVEIVYHVLWSCSAAADVWADKSSPVQKWPRVGGDFLGLWQAMVEKLQAEVLDLVATVMRNIWLRRNIYVFEGMFKAPTELFLQAQENLVEYKEEQVVRCNDRNARQLNRREARWKRPSEGFVKVNWDAALDSEKKRMRLGVVVRDEEGEVLLSLCKLMEGLSNSATAKLYALWEALKVCAELNWTKAIFEGDALSVIKSVNSSSCCWEWHGQLVEDIKLILYNSQNWYIQHTYRECNHVAHTLARIAFTFTEEKVWIEEGPSGIYSFVLMDKVCSQDSR
ncbi:uncharacterized protein LOC121249222 [Juglans microcarpa x Juglans regia]|uniref:uncharacterized protein LOC121249222 n=1 Tax=Juglans microcarpa x Juglans regia TaxID=2249226 RepID=UPI001B7DC1A2|nr:uncharacterized protein LOC121249222 [Juglans microcarpa x Juglans regia]